MPAGRATLAFLLLVLSAAIGVRAQPAGTGPGDISQPPEIRQLRRNYDEKTETLRDRAATLRANAGDPVTRTWATLALAEFENELEHEKETFELLDDLEKSAQALKVPDLEFAAQTLIN